MSTAEANAAGATGEPADGACEPSAAGKPAAAAGELCTECELNEASTAGAAGWSVEASNAGAAFQPVKVSAAGAAEASAAVRAEDSATSAGPSSEQAVGTSSSAMASSE